MRRNAELGVLMLVMLASLFLFDSAYNYSENAIFNGATGAVVATGSAVTLTSERGSGSNIIKSSATRSAVTSPPPAAAEVGGLLSDALNNMYYPDGTLTYDQYKRAYYALAAKQQLPSDIIAKIPAGSRETFEARYYSGEITYNAYLAAYYYSIYEASPASTAATSPAQVSAGGTATTPSRTVTDTLNEGEYKVYTIGGVDYRVAVSFVGSSGVKFTVNDEVTNLLGVYQSYTLANDAKISVDDFTAQDSANGIRRAKFTLVSGSSGGSSSRTGTPSSTGTAAGSGNPQQANVANVCMVSGSKAKCSLNNAEYETYGECTRKCKSTFIQAGPPPAAACAGNGEVPGSGQQCCTGLVPCNFCDNKCYNSCPNALCRAHEAVSCQSDSDCLGGSCVSDSAGNKKCGPVAGTQQPTSIPGSTVDVCTVSGSKVKCSLNNAEYETSGACTRNCKSNLIQPGTVTPPSSYGATTVPVLGGPDLVVKLTDFPSRMFWGERYEFKAIVTNNGDRSSADAQREGSAGGFSTFLGIVASDGTRYTIGNVPTVRLLPQESLVRSFDWNVPVEMASGTYRYLAIVDDGDRIEEVKEQNNRDDSKTVEILERPATSGVDMVIAIKEITDASNNPVTELVTGRSYRIAMEVENVGDVELPFTSFYSILYFDSDPSTALGRSSIASKQQGSLDFRGAKKVAWTYTWTVPDTVPTGNYKLEASTDTQNTIKEVDEENNRNVKPITVRKVTGANLAVISAAAVPVTSNAFHIEATIKNTGEAPVYIGEQSQQTQGGGSGIISFLEVDAKIKRNGQVVCQGTGYLYETIPPNSEKKVTIQLNGGNCLLERGNYVIDVRADPSNLILETDETGDNLLSTAYSFGTVSALACPGRVGTDIIVGYRTEDGLYCDASGQLAAQKSSGQPCLNSYECQSSLCLSGKCVGSCSMISDGRNVNVPVGTVIGTQYCSSDSAAQFTKESGSCQKGYECKSGVCQQNQCISDSAMRNALCWLKILSC